MGDFTRINSEGKQSVMLSAVCNEPVSLKVVKEPFYRKGFSPFVNKQTGTWWEYDDDKKGFFDTGIIAQGRDGNDYVITEQDYNTIVERTLSNVNPTLDEKLSSKLPKSPANWEPWTAEEQAAARERIGIYDSILSKDPIITETLSEEVTEIKIGLPKPLRHIFITVENSNSARIYAGNGVLIEKGGTNGIILVTDKIVISTDQRAFAKIDIIAGCAFAYWGSAPEIYQSTTFKFLNRIAMFENGISILRLDKANSTTFPIGTTLKVWGC